MKKEIQVTKYNFKIINNTTTLANYIILSMDAE